MRRTLPILLGVITIVLVILAWFQSGGVERRAIRSASTPEQAVRLMLWQIQSHNFEAAYNRLANRTDVDKNTFIREFTGSYGSLDNPIRKCPELEKAILNGGHCWS